MRKSLLYFIIAVGLLLRVVGSDWGFPFLLHPDENVVANMPVDMAQRSSLDPGEYNHPDHFDIYANAAIYHTASNLLYHKPLTETFAEHTLTYYRLSRTFVALLGTLCILVAFLIGREYTKNTGLIAAALVALFPSYVDHSHYITADIPLVLFLLSTVLFTLRYLKIPNNRNLVPALVCSALSVSVKYPGVLSLPLVLSIVTFLHYKAPKTLAIELAKSVALFCLALFLVSPYLFINFDQVVEALTANANPVHLGADGLGWSGNILYYASTFQRIAGSLLTVFFLAGTFLIVQRERARALPLFFGLVYWVALSKIGLHWERWAFPMFTCPLIVSAYGIDCLYQKSRAASQRYLPVLVAAACAVVLINLLAASATITANYTLKDTRYASYQYAQLSGIAEKNTLYEGFTPFYPSNMRDGSVRNAYFTLDRNKDIQYVIVSSGLFDRYLQEKERYQAENEFYDKVFALPLLKKFAPKEYSAAGNPFFLDTELTRDLAFLLDYARNGSDLLTGPIIMIYRYQHPGFLEREAPPGGS